MRYLSVFKQDSEILQAISDIHLRGKWFDADITYSKGVFWENITKPKYMSDLIPLYDFVKEDDSTKLETYEDNSLESIVFDPPFLFRPRKSENNDKICQRFSYFKSFEELITMYKNSLIAISKKLVKGGILAFKCQDMTDGKFYCTHNEIINMAKDLGYELRDIIIKATTQKLQRDAKQQNCVAKVHSYWLILKKSKPQEKAKWIHSSNAITTFRCSNCLCEPLYQPNIENKLAYPSLTQYCPSCGSKMEFCDILGEE